ncbi:MAG TPA: OmpA family protein [Kofleriaceae bacterium]|nr:OmpA family protein [Kofleriaceae bacterium]
MRAAWAIAIAAVVVIAGGCGDKKAKYPSCGSDRDCREGEHCVNRQCAQCAVDSHCKKGEECVKGACVLPKGGCRKDGDCKPGMVCLDNKCSACKADGECGPDRRCENGRCLARGACKTDEDCAEDEDCVEGVCRRGGRGKPPDVGCSFEPIYFGYDQANLDDRATRALNAAAECVQQAPRRGVFLTGHTDPRGTEEYNIALSERRAIVVADYLARLGIDPARFRVIPKGETEASGADEAGWAEDRRVEIEWQ